jgi:hypothetical protein
MTALKEAQPYPHSHSPSKINVCGFIPSKHRSSGSSFCLRVLRHNFVPLSSSFHAMPSAVTVLDEIIQTPKLLVAILVHYLFRSRVSQTPPVSFERLFYVYKLRSFRGCHCLTYILPHFSGIGMCVCVYDIHDAQTRDLFFNAVCD